MFLNSLLQLMISLASAGSLVKRVQAWTNEYGKEYLVSYKILTEQTVSPPNIAEREKYGDLVTITEALSTKAREAKDTVKKLLECNTNLDLLPPNPEIGLISLVQEAIKVLPKTSVLGWYIHPSYVSLRKKLKSRGIEMTFNSKDGILSELKSWLEYWTLRRKVESIITTLCDSGIPIERVSAQHTLAHLISGTSVADAYCTLLASISKFPQDTGSTYNCILRLMEGLTDQPALAQIQAKLSSVECLMNIATTLTRMKEIPASTSINAIIDEVLQSIRSCSIPQTLTDSINNLVELRDGYRYYEQFIEAELALTGLPNTLQTLRIQISSGVLPEWINHLEEAVSGFRLSRFIRQDLVTNPDDIGEIAKAISKLEQHKRDSILRALFFKRKLSLKEASTNRKIAQQIIKLRTLLGKKKKTVSLVQLKNKVEYEQLIQVFPCWILSIDDVARIFPLKAGLFDYLIVDEASQCNQATTLHLAYRAKRMVVVGDQQQMRNPNVRFLDDDVVKLLLTKYGLDVHPKAEFLHGRKSLLELSEYSANSSELLNEHFRCEVPIIAWSNREFYNSKLRVLTPIRTRRFKPSLEVHVVKGADDNIESKQNLIEAKTLIAEVLRFIHSGQAEGLTIGIMSLYREQATLLQNLLYESIEAHPEWLKKYQLIASTADGFQGDERDIIFYSLRYGPSSKPGTINAIQLEKERINVAFTRARRKMVIFISRPIDEFPRGLIRDFLLHAQQEHLSPIDRLGLPGMDKFDSDFEQDVCTDLRSRGLTVYTQVPCSSFNIDMVVIDNEGRRIAVECDGDFHYDEDGELRAEDYQRQDIIERSGWYVYRIPARRYYLNQAAAIEQLLEELSRQPSDDQRESLDSFSSRLNVVDSQSKFEMPISANQEEQLTVAKLIEDLSKKTLKHERGAVVSQDITQAVTQNAKNAALQGISDNGIAAVKNILEDVNNQSLQHQLGNGRLSVPANSSPTHLFSDKIETQKNTGTTSGGNHKTTVLIGEEPSWDKNVWFALSHWGKTSGVFGGSENSFCYNLGATLSRKIKLTPRQESCAKVLWKKAVQHGFEGFELVEKKETTRMEVQKVTARSSGIEDNKPASLCTNCLERFECADSFQLKTSCEYHRAGPTKRPDYWPTEFKGSKNRR